MNFVSPSGERDGGLRFDIFPGLIRTPAGGTDSLRAGIRPERARVAPPGGPGVPATVLRRSITIGGQYLLLLQAGNSRLRVRADPALARDLGDTVSLCCPIEHVSFFRGGIRIPDQPRPMS